MFRSTVAIRRISLLLILSSCTVTSSPWSTDSIAAGITDFDSSRLRYRSDSRSPVLFELVKMGDQIESFICLTRFRLPTQTKARFCADNFSFEEILAVHEGGMRARLSPETTQQLIQALQEGQKIVILLDDFEETLDPAQFSSEFTKFLEEGHFFLNLIKGPL